MRLTKLTVQQFRNYEDLTLSSFHPVNLFIGQNAQGKTNVLESIFTLALAKSHRTNKDKELIRWGETYARVLGEVEKKYGQIRLEIQLGSKGKKAKISGIEQKKLSEYIGALNVVMFAPEDLNIVKGSPQQRRRFLDMEIGQISPNYLYYRANYNKIIEQRNQLLKKLSWSQSAANDVLDVLNQQLADLSAKILQKRCRFLRKLEEWANAIHRGITREEERLAITYVHSTPYEEGMTEEEAVSEILKALGKMKEKEMERGSTLIGPHRDDLAFHVNDMDVQTYGSQGQQRTTALSLKLAEIELINEEAGEYPLLLLG